MGKLDNEKISTSSSKSSSSKSSFSRTLDEYEKFYTTGSSSSSGGAGSRASSSASTAYRSGSSGSRGTLSSQQVTAVSRSTGSRQRSRYEVGGGNTLAQGAGRNSSTGARGTGTSALGETVNARSQGARGGGSTVERLPGATIPKEGYTPPDWWDEDRFGVYEAPYWWDESTLGRWRHPWERQRMMRRSFSSTAESQPRAAAPSNAGQQPWRATGNTGTVAAGAGATVSKDRSVPTIAEGVANMPADATDRIRSRVREQVYLPIYNTPGSVTGMPKTVSSKVPDRVPVAPRSTNLPETTPISQGNPIRPSGFGAIAPMPIPEDTAPAAAWRSEPNGYLVGAQPPTVDVRPGWSLFGLQWPGFGFNPLPGMSAVPQPPDTGPTEEDIMSAMMGNNRYNWVVR